MRSNKYNQKRPPKIWDLPFGIRRQLSRRSGRQIAISDDGHLFIVLCNVPRDKTNSGERVFFWRNREHEWHYSERGGGFSSLEKLVQAYDDRVAELEESLENAGDSESRFRVLDEVTPVLRSARNLSDALHKAFELSEQQAEEVRRPKEPGRSDGISPKELGEDQEVTKIHTIFEQASEVARAAEILKSETESAIQFAHARQQEIQSHYVKQQSRAAHRLNILAATFLPVATISSVFGMNLASGFEGSHLLFWLVLMASIGVGAWIGYSVMNVRQLNPGEW
jgi:Mg2+ and Co2+ transporter CorA